LRALLLPVPPGETLLDNARSVAGAVLIDWKAIAEESQRHGMGMLLNTRLDNIGVFDQVDEEAEMKWRADARHAELQCALQRHDALLIHEKLEELELPHAFLKGFAYRESFYEPSWSRAGADVDILIDRRDIETVRSTFLRNGFVQASRTLDFRNFRPASMDEIRKTEGEHYELAQFARTHRLCDAPDWLFEPAFTRGAPFAFEMIDDGPVFHTVFDVHWALHFALAGENPLEVIEPFPVAGGHLLPGLSLEWNLLFSVFKLYFEAFDRPLRGLHQLVDLVGLLLVANDELDWSWISEMAAYHGFEAAFFYTTSAAETLAGEPLIPDDIHKSWSGADGPKSIWENKDATKNLDFGDFLPHVFGRRLAGGFLRADEIGE